MLRFDRSRGRSRVLWRSVVASAATVLVLTGVAAAPPSAEAASGDLAYIRPTYITVNPGSAPALPATVTGVLESGSTSTLSATWSATSSNDYATPGDVVVNGSVSGTSSTIRPVAYVHVNDYENLAAGRPVTTSSMDTGTSRFGTSYGGSRAVDGNRTGEWSRWNSAPNNSAASIEVDLQSVRTIDVVRLYWEIADASAYKVEVASSNHVFSTVSTVLDGDGGIDTVAFAPTAAQYVRMSLAAYGSQYSLYSLQELEVFNAAAPAISHVTPEVVQAKTNWVNSGSKVALLRLNSDPTLYYTTDGTDPRNSATRTTYTSSFALTAARTTVKAASISASGTYSAVGVYVYNLYPNHDLSAVPKIIAAAHPNLVDLYNGSWATAVQWSKQGTAANGFVDRWHDEGFNDSFFQVDSAYVSIMNDFSNDQFASVDTLDNSYRKQSDIAGASLGYIDREQSEANGQDAQPYNDPQSINPPLFAWAEWLHYEKTGDASHFLRPINGKTVLQRLVNYYNWIAANRTLTTGQSAGLLYNGRLATGYDNTTAGGEAWVDMTAQQASSALYISKIAALVGQSSLASSMQSSYNSLASAINSKMYDASRGYYFNRLASGSFDAPFTGLGMFPFIAKVPTVAQANAVVQDHLLNTGEFNTGMPLPNLAANDPNYTGTFFRGSVTFNNTYQIMRGLDDYGFSDVTRDFAIRAAEAMSRVYQDAHTWIYRATTEKSIWSSYSPTYPYFPAEGTDAQFVGWSGLGATASVVESGIGLRANAPSDSLRWNLGLPERNGIENYKFGDNTASITAAARKSSGANASITVTTDSPFTLQVLNGGVMTTVAVAAGTSTISADGNGSGSYEAEQQTTNATGGSTATQDMQGFAGQWGAHAQLIWGAPSAGSQLDVAFPVIGAQTKALTVALTQAPDFGQIQLLVDGNPVGSQVDLYATSVRRTSVSLSSLNLTSGTHMISIKVVGKNSNSSNYFVGFDSFSLT